MLQALEKTETEPKVDTDQVRWRKKKVGRSNQRGDMGEGPGVSVNRPEVTAVVGPSYSSKHIARLTQPTQKRRLSRALPGAGGNGRCHFMSLRQGSRKS
jgi:hypothetical protein